MKLSNLPFKIESELFRAWYRHTKDKPGSGSYLTGDGFRRWADWTYEPENADAFDPSAVSPDSLGFCDGWILERFLKEVTPRITVPFRLISHNADPNVGAATAALVLEQVTQLFTMNALTDDLRVTPLPIGLENARFHYNGVVRDFEKLRKRSIPKRSRILVAFTVGTNAAARGLALAQLQPLPTVDTLSRTNSRAYRKIAAGYQFIASPPGNGEDCHRTWEALYLRAVPIVVRSKMTESFVARGLPLWLVDSYAEVSDMTEQDLARKYEELSPGFLSPWLWMDAWKTLIVPERM